MARPNANHAGVAAVADSAASSRNAFPQILDDFEDDPRVSFSKITSKWVLENDDGTEWEYDEARQKWMPSLDEDLVKQQARAYGPEDTNDQEQDTTNKKRRGSDADQDLGSQTKMKKQKGSKRDQKQPPKNTAVYLTSLPLDATVEEINATFSRFGVIAEEVDTGNPRIKLYNDDAGNPKGDALVIYFKPESVGLAIQMLDDTELRYGVKGPAGNMRVTEADRSYKKAPDGLQAAPEAGDVKKKQQQSHDKKKAIKSMQKLNDKLTDWSDDDTSALASTSSRFDKVVILKHMFSQKELQDDPAAILDIKEDIRDECGKLGEVTNVQLFDKEKDGVVSVRFDNAEAAKACIRLMDGRMFGGQVVEAHISDGLEKYKKSKAKKEAVDEGESNEEDERMDKFGEYLEGKGS